MFEDLFGGLRGCGFGNGERRVCGESEVCR